MRGLLRLAAGLGLAPFLLSSCAGWPPPSSPRIYSHQEVVRTQEGTASYYGGRWIGRLTASGERYRANDLTAAHRKLPFDSVVRVTNLKNQKSVIVRINNRGPYARGRMIDLSIAAAKRIDMVDAGVARVKLEVLKEIPVLMKPNLRKREE
ncbi:MAG TPA: septal ring lytic transglycosylase RlpA family protein [Chthoniobacterales bacterium]